MFFKQTINKIKLLNKDKESYPDLIWLEKDQENLHQFMAKNSASVRKEEPASLKIVEKVNFTKLNAQEARQFAFLGLKLKQEFGLSEKGLSDLIEKDKDVTESPLVFEATTNQQAEILEDLIRKVPHYQSQKMQTSLEQAAQATKQGQIKALEIIIQAGEKGYSET